MPMNPRQLYDKVKEGLRTVKGRNALTFLVFLAISAVFWVLMALNDEVQHDYRLKLKLAGFPDNMTIISGANPTVSVSVKDKGSALMKFTWNTQPELTVNYDEFSKAGDHNLLMTQAQLNSAVRNIFGSSATIIAVRPDSLSLHYTTNPGVPVKVRIDADVRPAPSAVAFGRVTLSTDTVMLYSNSKERSRIKTLTTQPIILTGLTDTAHVSAALIVPPGMRAVPSQIKVTIPVEPLVTKTRKVEISQRNVPAGKRLVTFPSMAEVDYLLPKSLYNSDSSPVKVVVDFSAYRPGEKKLPVTVLPLPNYYRFVSVRPSEVEFVIEEK